MNTSREDELESFRVAIFMATSWVQATSFWIHHRPVEVDVRYTHALKVTLAWKSKTYFMACWHKHVTDRLTPVYFMVLVVKINSKNFKNRTLNKKLIFFEKYKRPKRLSLGYTVLIFQAEMKFFTNSCKNLPGFCQEEW